MTGKQILQSHALSVKCCHYPRLRDSPPDAVTPTLSGRRGLVVPIFIELRNLTGDVLSLITSSYNQYAPAPIEAAEMDKLLRKYNCLLLFDGLDDIRANPQAGGIQSIRQFIDGHPDTRHLFSCRVGGYFSQLGRAIVLELDLLTVKDAKTVLGDRFYDDLSPALQDLARYRLMLKDIIQSRESGGAALISKGQLVQHMMRQHYGLSGLDQTTRLRERLLEWLAYQMQRDRSPSYGEQQLREKIGSYLQDWRESLSWRQGLESIEESAAFQYDGSRSRWAFGDRNTQTYFVAAAMAQNRDLLATALDETSDPLWAEAFEILVGIVDDPSRLLFELVDRDPTVAARCFSLARPPVQANFQDALLDALIDALGRETAEGREDIARFLIRNPLTNVEHTERALLDALQREWRSGSIRALTQALLPLVTPVSPDEETTSPQLKVEDERERLRTVIRLWRAHVDGTPAGAVADSISNQQWRSNCERRLTEVMNDHNQVELVRGVAAIVLGAIGSDSARASLLIKWRKESMTETLGWCVTEGLAHLDNYADITDVKQAALKGARRKRRKLARTNNLNSTSQQATASATVVGAERREAFDVHRERRRVWAFYLLGYLNLKDEATDLLFKALDPQLEESYRVRGYAAQAIGRLQPREGRQKLLDALSAEQDLRVMRKIVWALSQVGTPDTIPILENYLRTGRVQARTIVQRSIAEIRRRYDASG